VKAIERLWWGLFFALPVIALYVVFMVVPNERTMGAVQRIFYFHVGSASTAFLAFFVVMIASIGFLATRKPLWDRVAFAAAEVGVVFLTIVLVTGPLWARPVWGRYWVWQDTRLVTTLVLWVYFCLYLFLRRGWANDPQGQRFAAIMGIVGFLDVPIIYLSVRWWNFIHPSHVVGPMGGGLHPTMARALGLSTMAVLVIGIGLVVLRVRLESLLARVNRLTRELTNERA
jgi:heme exporter protein C